MDKKAMIVAIVAAVVIAGGGIALLAARNGSNDTSSTSTNGTGSTNTDTSNDTSGTDSTTKTATNSVVIQDFAFTPAHITIKKGTTVTWMNRDSATHTVTQDQGSSTSGPGMDSKGLAQGETYNATFNTIGTFTYHCSLHPNMVGSVTVTE